MNDGRVEGLWIRFRALPRALQVVCWLILWPFLLSLKLVAGDRLGMLRWLVAGILTGVVGTAWVVSWAETLSGQGASDEITRSAGVAGDSAPADQGDASAPGPDLEDIDVEVGSGVDVAPSVTTVAPAFPEAPLPVSTVVPVRPPSISMSLVSQSCEYSPRVTIRVLNTGEDVVSGGVFVPADLGEGGYVPLFGSFLSLEPGDSTAIELTSLDDCGDVFEVGVPSAARLFTPGYRPEPLPDPAVAWTELSIECDRSTGSYSGAGIVENLTDDVVTGGFFLVVDHSDRSFDDRLGAVVERLAPRELREVSFGFEAPCPADSFELSVQTAFAF